MCEVTSVRNHLPTAVRQRILVLREGVYGQEGPVSIRIEALRAGGTGSPIAGGSRMIFEHVELGGDGAVMAERSLGRTIPRGRRDPRHRPSK
jgi:hypothetical protein